LSLVSKPLVAFVFTFLVLFATAACSAEPATMDDVPLYPGVQPLEGGENSVADQVLEAMQGSAEERGLIASFKLYSLPADANWDDIVAFYDEELVKSDWQPEPELTNDSDLFKAVGWSRGEGARQQSLVVNYVPDVIGEGAFLIVGLLSK
jgi:hypothetical protein